MVRLKVMMAGTGAVLFLFSLLVFAQSWDSRPWDEPVLCPKCKSDRVVYILYGEPKMDEDLKRALDIHKVELGGCIITPDSKRWECRSCGHNWGKVAPGIANPP
jgi:hypothetical protein